MTPIEVAAHTILPLTMLALLASGSGAQGFPGYPNLNDDARLWGGSV